MAKDVAIICIGMAGSGKTTFMQRLNADLHAAGEPPYVINLDPAVLEVPYEANIDIRDTVDYKAVMEKYGLGPNGAILTALNLFTTKFDQVLDILQGTGDGTEGAATSSSSSPPAQRKIIIDTPGQIEIFTWSASGAIITEALASAFPTVIVYVVDTPRCLRPATFMSNMLYACSIMYKTRLPMVVAFNKTDVQEASFALHWMDDVIAFQEALAADDSYMSSLTQSMSLLLDEFYSTLRAVALSAQTGEGMDDFFAKLAEAVSEYNEDFLPMLTEARRPPAGGAQPPHERAKEDGSEDEGNEAEEKDEKDEKDEIALDDEPAIRSRLGAVSLDDRQ